MKHIDLFSGIGGFALAVDTVWPNSEHAFCDNDPFCQQVLRKHWPNSKIYGDIRQFTTNAKNQKQQLAMERKQDKEDAFFGKHCDILTGGFPCQPFSQAGRRQGTADDRYLWPEMFRVIREFKPTWVIAENVRGLVTWNEGMVLEQVCTDLEREGYEVQPFIIPAVALNAPHRRDRVWFIAYRSGNRRQRKGQTPQNENWEKRSKQDRELARGFKGSYSNVTDSKSVRGGRGYSDEYRIGKRKFQSEKQGRNEAWSEGSRRSWNDNWFEVATELCGMDDGLSAELDGFKLTKAGHRKERLKALGNAIVPQVAIAIMRQIKNING